MSLDKLEHQLKLILQFSWVFKVFCIVSSFGVKLTNEEEGGGEGRLSVLKRCRQFDKKSTENNNIEIVCILQSTLKSVKRILMNYLNS